MSVLLGILAILGVLLAVAVVTAFAISAVMRDTKRGTSGTLGSAALEVQSILEPDKKKAVETMRTMKEQEEEDGSGEE